MSGPQVSCTMAHPKDWACPVCDKNNPAQDVSDAWLDKLKDTAADMRERGMKYGLRSHHECADMLIELRGDVLRARELQQSQVVGAPIWFAVDTPGSDFDTTFVTSYEEALAFAEDNPSAITPLYTRAPIAEGGGDHIVDANKMVWAARILAAHNAWRRDDEGDAEQGNPNDIGRAIDIAIESLSRQGGEEMIEMGDGGVRLPKWLIESSERIGRYMDAHHPGHWELGRIQSRRGHTRASEAGDWVMVPREATKAMIDAALAVKPLGQFYPGHTAAESEYMNEKYHGGERRANIYAAMIAAAPAPGGDA